MGQNNTIEKRYGAGHIERGYKLALLGLTNKELAIAFDVTEKTIIEWLKKHIEFRSAVESARTEADAKAAASLYQRALGYDKPVTKVATKDGEFTDRITITEHVAPDVGAAQFWLKNRQKHLWTDRSEVEMTGSTGITVKFDIPRPKIEDLRVPKKIDVEVTDADSSS